MRQNWIFNLLAGLVATLMLAACQSGGVTAGSAESAAAMQEPVEYRLGNGDELRVTVFGEPDLSGVFEVDGTGAISMPLIGTVPVSGLTLPEFQAEIERRLGAGYLNEPRVSAEVTNFRPFYILGEVNRPDEYPYTSGLTVMNAVAAAGGFTYRANRRVVFIRSEGESVEREVPLTTTTLVQPGDTIRIGERIF